MCKIPHNNILYHITYVMSNHETGSVILVISFTKYTKYRRFYCGHSDADLGIFVF